MGRSKLVSAKPKKIMPHDEFIDRIRKSLYYGGFEEEDSELEISGPLAEYAADLFSEPHRKGHSLNRLTRVAAGKIQATPCSLIMALIYLDRLNMIDPGYVRRITPQELFVVSLMISTKFYAGYDQQIYLDDWAEEGNMSEDKLKSMELEFLSAIDWNVYISNEQFFDKLNNVERTLAQREGLRRGWLTYGELSQWLPSFTLMKFMLNSITVLAVSYAASVMTIAGAFFLASQIPGTIFYHRTHVDETKVTNSTTTANVNTNESIVSNSTILLPHERLTRNATSSITSFSAATVNTKFNETHSSCNALNVEAELLKLEQQYCEEAKKNEKTTNLKFQNMKLPLSLHNNILSRRREHRRQLHLTKNNTNNWLTFKSDYSDGNYEQQQQQEQQQKRQQQKKHQQHNLLDFMHTKSVCNSYEDLFNTIAATTAASMRTYDGIKYNSTSALWQLLNGMMVDTFERLPMFWLKFI